MPLQQRFCCGFLLLLVCFCCGKDSYCCGCYLVVVFCCFLLSLLLALVAFVVVGAYSDSDTIDDCVLRIADSINYAHSKVADVMTGL